MKAKTLLAVCALLVAAAALLNAQATAPLNSEYESKAKAVRPDDARGHFDLATWAFKQGLYQETELEAQALLKLDSGDLRAKYLKMAAEFYRTGAFTEAQIEPGKGIRPKALAANIINLTDEQVDGVYKEYGDKTMGEFRQLCQAVLIPRCATADCHGNPDKSGALYLKTEKPTDKTTLAENVKALEPYTNRMDLAASRLLSVTLEPADKHPGGPIFRDDKDPNYQRLKSWVTKLPGLWGR